MMKATKTALLIMLMGVVWVPSVSSGPILFEDFESVTPGENVMPAGWINSFENSTSGTGSSGTAAATQGSMLPNQFGFTRGPSTGGSNSVTGFGIETPFTVADSLSCTYRCWVALSEGISGSWADSAAEHVTLGGGPFHTAGTVQLAQCNDGTPDALDATTCPAGGAGGPNQNCYLFRAVANVRYWSIAGGSSAANTGAGLNCNGEAWTPSTNKLSQAIHMAMASAQDYDNSLQIKITLETGGTGTGKKLEWRQGFSGALSGAGEPNDIGSSVCALAADTQVAFSTYATGLAIDDVIIEDTNNIIPVELSGYSID
jgi:hypothetical protein